MRIQPRDGLGEREHIHVIIKKIFGILSEILHDASIAQGKQPRTQTMRDKLGDRLRWAREIVAESQSDICRRLDGIDTSTWNRWEKGTRYPDPVVMVKLCDLFGLTMDYLYRGDLRGVREDVALRPAAYHPKLGEDGLPAAARRAAAGERAA